MTRGDVVVVAIVSVPRRAVGRVIGRLDAAELRTVSRALRDWLAL
jgi:mRNA-degrading endonuclease toxin of MazEF toxin-antitoxin module